MSSRDPRVDPKPGDSIDIAPEMRGTLKKEGRCIHRKRKVREVSSKWVRYEVLPIGVSMGTHKISLLRWRQETADAKILGMAKWD